MSTERRPRCREAGIHVGSLPTGPKNSITDIPGVRVGHCTLNNDAYGSPARTGVTAIWPGDGDLVRDPVIAGTFMLNGFGEMTGRTAVDEWGILNSPICLTATMSVGITYHAVLQYLCEKDPDVGRLELPIPLVAECDDSFLNDSRAFHVRPEHVFKALDSATDGPVEEGCVGAGTGMSCFQFKGGVGSASRRLSKADGAFVVGVLVETNFGRRPLLRIDGVPVGQHITDLMPQGQVPSYWGESGEGGSCIVVVGTNAPLTNHQVARLAKRGALGLARTGSIAGNSSGELLMAFSTANRQSTTGKLSRPIESLNDRRIDVVYQAVVEATEEAVVNSLFAARTTTGRDGNTVHAIPIDRTLQIMREYNRLAGN